MVEIIISIAMVVVISVISEFRVLKSDKKVKLLKEELAKAKLREEDKKVKLIQLANETAKLIESSEIIYEIAKEEIGGDKLEEMFKERKEKKANELNDMLKALFKERKDKPKQ